MGGAWSAPAPTENIFDLSPDEYGHLKENMEMLVAADPAHIRINGSEAEEVMQLAFILQEYFSRNGEFNDSEEVAEQGSMRHLQRIIDEKIKLLTDECNPGFHHRSHGVVDPEGAVPSEGEIDGRSCIMLNTYNKLRSNIPENLRVLSANRAIGWKAETQQFNRIFGYA